MLERLLFVTIVILLMTTLAVLMVKNCGSGAEHSLCREWPGYSTQLVVKPHE
jgi:hypothetical protein